MDAHLCRRCHESTGLDTFALLPSASRLASPLGLLVGEAPPPCGDVVSVTRDYSKWLNGDDVYNNVKDMPATVLSSHFMILSRVSMKLKTALPRSLQWLKDQGYEFKRLPDNPDETRF